MRHDVWFLDAVTALNQMRAAQHAGHQDLRAVASGLGRPLAVAMWDMPGDADAPEKLKDVPPGQDVDMEGQGEILRIEARPANGKRAITVDPSTGPDHRRDLQNLPEPYRVGAYGASPKQMAITFDDGPDPQWTPKILDMLKKSTRRPRSS